MSHLTHLRILYTELDFYTVFLDFFKSLPIPELLFLNVSSTLLFLSLKLFLFTEFADCGRLIFFAFSKE